MRPQDRVAANLAALDVLATIRDEERGWATEEEQLILGRYGGWGGSGVWQELDPARTRDPELLDRVRRIVGDAGLQEMRSSTRNANYTDADLVASMWRALQRAGFREGRVLEPGCGTGNFIGFAPPGARVTGVELDSTSAHIAALLYPDAEIRSESFAFTAARDSWFDLAVGNVPFGDAHLYDPKFNPDNRLSIHNHFLVKSLTLTAPGGYLAMITSSYTMDSKNAEARRRLATLGDLVTAIRLPSRAHLEGGATEVVTDILVFRRRDPEAESVDVEELAWIDSIPMDFPTPSGGQETYWVNTWWRDRPDQLLGVPSLAVGLYGVMGLRVDGPTGAELIDQLDERLSVGVDVAKRHDLGYGPVHPVIPEGHAAAAAQRRDGELVVHSDKHGHDAIWQVRDGALTPVTYQGSVATPKEMRALLGLKDGWRTLVELETASFDDTPELDQARSRLLASWRMYVNQYGAVNRHDIHYRRSKDSDDIEVDEKGEVVRDERGKPARALVPVAVRPTAVAKLLDLDPYGPVVLGLEQWEEGWDQPKAAPILERRQIMPRPPRTGVDTVEDGLAIVLDRDGYVNIPGIASLIGADTDPAKVVTELGDRVFELPDQPGQYVTAAAYLSGNVVVKLDCAREAALRDPTHWGRNVTSLEAIQPVPIPMTDIQPRLGASWIPADDIRDFVVDTLAPTSGWQKDSMEVTYLGPGRWRVDGPTWVSGSGLQTWGTERRSFYQLTESLLNGAEIVVFDTVKSTTREGKPGTKQVRNEDATVAALSKADDIKARFTEWIWDDPSRASRLCDSYNRVFNNAVSRDYTVEGTMLRLPGLSQDFHPMPHQRAAVARVIAEPTTGLFHEVGAGKTAEIIISTMELRRLELANKPMVVVPNHLVGQWVSEWLRLYPGANLLVAGGEDGETAVDRRRQFVLRSAMNDWDAVIVPLSTFDRIGVLPGTRAAYLRTRLSELDALLAGIGEDGADRNIKEVEKIRDRITASIEAVMGEPIEPGQAFEETGADMLIVDEIQCMKNLAHFALDEKMSGSNRATSFDMKLGHLRNMKPGGHVLVGATGTPISNSVAELWVMQHYFRPDEAAQAGVAYYADWRATFADLVYRAEVGADSQTFKMKARLARFVNVPELVQMMHSFGDVKLQEDLNLSRPDLAVNPATDRREPNAITISPNEELLAYIGTLVERMEEIHKGHVRPEEDNALKVMTDGAHASLDMRLRGGSGGLKLGVAADLLYDVWNKNRDRVYLDATGNQSANPGALQTVFCDLATPKQDAWNVYDGLKSELVARGMDASLIQFIHDADSQTKKDRLFADCREGRIAILVGSTDKMGTGTNVQTRLVHQLHLDQPWRPDQLEQRDGRILRQGNQNPDVAITHLIVEKSFDSIRWQTLERKARFIHQVMSGTVTDRVAEDVADIGDESALYAAFLAEATGNPLLLKQAEASAEVARLTALERSWRQNQGQLTWKVSTDTHQIAHLTQSIADMRAALATHPESDRFHLIVGTSDTPGQYGDEERWMASPVTVTERTVAAEALSRLVDPLKVGTYTIAVHNGYRIRWTPPSRESYDHQRHSLLLGKLSITGLDVSATVPVQVEGAHFDLSWLGLVTRIVNMTGSIADKLAEAEQSLRLVENSKRVNESLIGQPFSHSTQLAEARATLAALDRDIAEGLTQQPELEPRLDTNTNVGGSIPGPVEHPGRVSIGDDCPHGATVAHVNPQIEGITVITGSDNQQWFHVSHDRMTVVPDGLKHNPETRAGWWKVGTDSYLLRGVFAEALNEPASIMTEIQAVMSFMPPAVQRAWAGFCLNDQEERTPPALHDDEPVEDRSPTASLCEPHVHDTPTLGF